MNTYRKWTDEDERLLLELKAAGKRLAFIAKELRRTEAAVIARLVILKKREKEGLLNLPVA